MCLLAGPLLLETVDKLEIDTHSKFVLLDRLADPHNVGTIIRSAYFLGIDAVFIEQQNM